MSIMTIGAAVTVLTLGRQGVLNIYTDFSLYSFEYFLFSIVFMILAHDFYFYWLHRLMHTKYFFKNIHYVHHRGSDTTSAASFCFHPVEAFLNMCAILLQATIFPVHPYAIMAFNVFMMLYNVIGHLGYEFFPKFWVNNPLTDLFVTTTHHNMHHKKTHGNYGLYFTFWDRIMNTEFSDYKTVFKAIRQR